MFFAIGIFDRYLARQCGKELTEPFTEPAGPFEEHTEPFDFVLLGAVCLTIAAKLNQPLSPSLNHIIQLLNVRYYIVPICKKQLVDLEFQVVKSLEFEVQVQTPTTFLGRYLIFFLRKMKSRSEILIIENTADQFLKFSAFMAELLEYKPSHIAAAVCVLTLNIFASQAVLTIGIAKEPFKRVLKLQ